MPERFQPSTQPAPAEPPEWLPQIDAQLCTGCGDCITACPVHALAARGAQAALAHPEACTYCGDCEALCPVGAIALPYQIVVEG